MLMSTMSKKLIVAATSIEKLPLTTAIVTLPVAVKTPKRSIVAATDSLNEFPGTK